MKLNKRIWLNAGAVLSVAMVVNNSDVVSAVENVEEDKTQTTDEEVKDLNVDETIEEVNEQEDTEEDTEEDVEVEEVKELPTVEDIEKETEVSVPNVDSEDTIEEEKEAPKKETPKEETSTKPTTQVYTVKSGDTLSRIASTYNTTVDNLVKWNNLANRNMIFVGQRLNIQSTASQGSTGNSGSSESSTSTDKPKENTGNVEITEKMTPSQFINTVSPVAQKVASEHGLYASVMIAQAALESGFGGSSLSLAPNYNLFGIKGSYNGQTAPMMTSEYVNGSWIRVIQNFKKYPSHSASFADNARLLRNGLSWNSKFYSGTWVENTNSFRDATQWLQGRYATDPTYANKLNTIINRYDLTRYDNSEFVNNEKSTEKESTPTNNSNSNTKTTTYTVVRGDTLNKIARQHDTTVSRIKSDNNLRSDLIIVGQRLTIRSTSQQSTPTEKPVESTSNSKAESTTSNREYTIKRGDTLSGIARAHSTTVRQLKEWNNLSSDLIFVNQKLIVGRQSTGSTSSTQSSSSASSEQTMGTSSSSSQTQTRTHRVVRGDTLYGLARQYGTTVSRIRSLNNLTSDTILINQRLIVGSSSSNTPTTQSNTRTYTVRSGDNLTRIARANNTTVSNLMSWNNLRSDLIRTGQTLIVRR